MLPNKLQIKKIIYYHITSQINKSKINRCIINMDSNDELKEINIRNCTCYYFGDIIKIEDFNLNKVLTDENSHEDVFVCNMSYKTLIDARLLHIRFDKIDRFIQVYNQTRYLLSPPLSKTP